MFKKVFRTIVVFILTYEARLILRKYRPRIIAVTGSVGKTSAKEAIYAALGSGVDIRRNEKSLNSEIGVPLTIIGAQSAWGSAFGWLRIIVQGFVLIALRTRYPKTLITEVGADHPNDIKRIARWLRPDIAVITGVPDMPVHIEHFGSADAVFSEKAKLAAHLKEGGAFVANYDDARTRALAESRKGRVITYGITGGDISARNSGPALSPTGKPLGMRFRVDHKGASISCEIPNCVGDAHVLAALAGFAVALSDGHDLFAIAERFQTHSILAGRMRILDGLNGSIIIDDSYNSSPPAALLALDTLKALPAEGRRVAVLGDMRELGEHSRPAHELVGRKAAEVAQLIITVGEESRALAEAAKLTNPTLAVRSYGYGESAKAGEDFSKEVRSGDIVLVKGSQNMIRMERFVKAIMAEPWRAKELLVRQEPEWQAIA